MGSWHLPPDGVHKFIYDSLNVKWNSSINLNKTEKPCTNKNIKKDSRFVGAEQLSYILKDPLTSSEISVIRK
jgi:hypothetical protein